MHKELKDLTWLNDRPMARDSWTVDFYGFDEESWPIRESQANTDLFEDTLNNLMPTSITAPALQLPQNNCFAADFLYEYRPLDQIDDIFDPSIIVTAQKSADSTPVTKCGEPFTDPGTLPEFGTLLYGTVGCSQDPSGCINQKLLFDGNGETKLSACLALPRDQKREPKVGPAKKVARDNGGIKRDIKAVASKSFVCEHCGKVFAKCVALGGHISRAHPGQSLEYKQKLATRKANEHKRLARTWAKEQCKDMFDNEYKKKRIAALR